MRLLRAFRKDESGLAAMELAMLSPIVIVMVVCTIDVGRLALAKTWTQYAAAAGAQYAVQKGFDSQAISAAIQAATSSKSVLASPTPGMMCGCPGETGITPATCGQKCPASARDAGSYVTVTASYAFKPIFRVPVVSYPEQVTSQSIVRIQ